MDNQLVTEGDTLSVGESGFEFVLLREVIQDLEDEGTETGCLQDLDQFGDQAAVIHMGAQLSVKAQVEEQAQGDLEEELVVARNETFHLLDDAPVLHLVFVVAEDTQLFQEVEHDEEQVWVITVQHRHQLRNDTSVLHLALDLQVLSQVQQQVERDKKHFLLLLDHHGQFFLLFLHDHRHFVILWLSEHLLKVLRFLFEFADAHNIPFDLVLDNTHGSVSDLVLDQDLLEVGEV